MNKFLKIWPFIIIIFFSLTPLLWFYQKGDILINGVDTNFPLDPLVWFQRRLFVWNSISNTGADFSSSTAGLFFHFIQLLPYKLGLDLQNVQIFSFVFWFALIAFPAYFFAKTILPKNYFAQLVLVSLYSFNTYLFNTWENVKVANLSLVSSIPLALGGYILLKEGKASHLKAGIIFVLAGILLSGAGINPAYFISFYLIIFIFFIADLLTDLSKINILKKLKGFTLLVALVTVVNLFWLLPTTSYIFKNITPSDSINSLGFINWVESLSLNTSILNVLRLQGAWDWYATDEKTGEPYYIDYSTVYFSRIPFVVFSFLIPIMALASLIVWQKKINGNKYIVAFLLMLIVGVFLGVGSHQPTGAIFRFLMNHLPFFSLFRSPWYIFTPMTILALSTLTGFFFYYLHERVKEDQKFLIKIFATIIIIGNLIYSYPQVTGKIFRLGREDSFYVTFPGYIFDAKKWLDSQDYDSRVIGYPDDRIEAFNWGYRGVDSILHLLSKKEIIFSPLNTQGSAVSGLIDDFYLHLKRGELDSAKSIAAKLNASMVLNKNDQVSLLINLPEKIKELPKTSFGEWDFYRFFPDSSLSKIYVPTQLYLDYTRGNNVSALEIIGQKDILLNPQDSVVLKIEDLNIKAGQIIKSENSQVSEFEDFQNSNYKIAKSLSMKDLSKVIFKFEVLNSGLYQPLLERYQLENFGLDLTKELIVVIDGKKETLKIINTSDSYVFFEPVNFKNGEHLLELSLQNNNLVKDFWNDGKINILAKAKGEVKKVDEGGEKTVSLKNQGEYDLSYDVEFNPFDPMSDYFVQVKYKHIYGYAPKVILNQFKNGEITKRHLEQLPLSPEWDVFNFYYHPHDSNSKLRVSLMANFSKQNPLGTKVAYKELVVERIFSNKLMFLKQPDMGYVDLPKVSYKQVSPVEYRGEVKDSKGEHLLVFLENYSPFWRIAFYNENGTPLNINSDHFSANLYANAWYLSQPPQNYSFVITYSPQELFNRGVMLSVLGTIVILSLLMIGKKYVK